MRSTSARFLLAVTFLACARMAAAQTADDIVEKTLTAQGGREAMGKITSRSTKGTIIVTSPAGDLPGTIDVIQAQCNDPHVWIVGVGDGVARLAAAHGVPIAQDDARAAQ